MAESAIDLLKRSVADFNAWRLDQRDAVLDLKGADLSEANLDGADLSVAILDGVNFTKSSLRGANLKGSQLRGALLTEADLTEFSSGLFSGQRTNADQSNLSDAVVDRAEIDADFQSATLDRLSAQNTKWWTSNFSESSIQYADFMESDLGAAGFRYAEIVGSKFWACDLGGTDFRDTIAIGADFRNSNLFNAKLGGGNFQNARFDGCVLNRAGHLNADFGNASFVGASLPPFWNPPPPDFPELLTQDVEPPPRQVGVAEAAGAGCGMVFVGVFVLIVIGAVAGQCLP